MLEGHVCNPRRGFILLNFFFAWKVSVEMERMCCLGWLWVGFDAQCVTEENLINRWKEGGGKKKKKKPACT